MTLGLNCMVCLCLSGSEWCQECSGQDTGLRKKVIDRVRIVGGGWILDIIYCTVW